MRIFSSRQRWMSGSGRMGLRSEGRRWFMAAKARSVSRRFGVESLEDRRVMDCTSAGSTFLYSAADDWTAAQEGTPAITLDALANDVEYRLAGPNDRIVSVTNPSRGGTVSVVDGRNVRYVPPADFLGQDCFTYTLDNGNSANVFIDITPRLITAFDWYQFDVSVARQTFDLPVLDNDIFPDDYTGLRRITSVTAPDGGEIAISSSGQSLSFTPPEIQEGLYRVSYTIDNRYQGEAAVSVTGYLVPDFVMIAVGKRGTTLDVLANDFQNDGVRPEYQGPRRITSVSPTSSGGTVTLSSDGRELTYRPGADSQGHDYFTYTVDGVQQAQVSIQLVEHVQSDRYRVEIDSVANTFPVLLNDRLGIGYTGVGRITEVTAGSSGGSISISADGTSLGYVPATGFQGTESFEYTVDGVYSTRVDVVVGADRSAVLPRFNGPDDLKGFLLVESIQRFASLFGQEVGTTIVPGIGHWFGNGDWRTQVQLFGPSSTAGNDHSGTNNQFVHVDEGDIVETDGDYLFVLRGSELVIIDARPAAEMQVVSRTAIEGSPVAMFLQGDRLAVISTPFEDWVLPSNPAMNPNGWIQGGDIMMLLGKTRVDILDVSQRGQPTIAQTTVFDGYYGTSRVVGDHLFVQVLGIGPNGELALPAPETVQGIDGQLRYETQAEYTQRMESGFGAWLEATLPRYRSLNVAGDVVRSGVISEVDEIYRPGSSPGRQLMTIASMNLQSSDPGIVQSATVAGSAFAKVMATADNVYIFDQAVEANDWFTEVRQFAWNGQSGTVDYHAAGRIQGSVHNQFAADEHRGYLRVVTTDWEVTAPDQASQQPVNDLWVLREDQGVLELVSAIRNVAPGETVQSARFDGDRAFFVTFRVVDPLFAVDLSDPEAPRLAAELKIPGYSSYLKVISENRLLGIGFDGNVGSGMQISLFDISDLDDPRTIQQFYLADELLMSSAQWDHLAVGWYPETGTLAVPGTLHRPNSDNPWYEQAHGTAVFTIDVMQTAPSTSAIRWDGMIEHLGNPLRTARIDNLLYSVAYDGVKAVPFGQIDQIVGEVLIEDVPIEPQSGDGHPSLAAVMTRLESAMGLARQSLERTLGDMAMDAVFVTAEPSGGGLRLVYRVGEQHYEIGFAADGSISREAVTFEFAASREALVWHNQEMSRDVNGDGVVSPHDALRILSELTERGAGPLTEQVPLRGIRLSELAHDPAYLDVDGNRHLGPLDALLVINDLPSSGDGNTVSTRLVMNPSIPLTTGSETEDESWEMASDDTGHAAAIDQALSSFSELPEESRGEATSLAVAHLVAPDRSLYDDDSQSHKETRDSVFDQLFVASDS